MRLRNNRYSRYDELYKPRVVGMFAAAAFIATTEGLEDPHPIRKSLHYALKSAVDRELKVMLVKEKIAPFCRLKIKKRVSPRTEAAFALEPFIEMQEQSVTPGGPNRIHGMKLFRPATRDDLRTLIDHCQGQEELKQFRRKNH